MHYYTFNIGDYRRDTAHLSALEHGIYRQLIDWYLLDEAPIPKETQSVIRRLRLGSDDEKNALENVLKDFFFLENDAYHQARCDSEILNYKQKAEKNAVNGAKGGRPVKKTISEKSTSYESQETQWVNLGFDNETQAKAKKSLTHKPINPLTQSIGTNVPMCPHEKIKTMFNEKLGAWLPTIKTWGGKRPKDLQARWKFLLTATRSNGTRYATNEEEGLQKFSDFFDMVAESDSLCGRKKYFDWRADIDYLISLKGFTKTIEGGWKNTGAEE